jgi:CheY-like chemotaxis protein
MEKTSLPEPPSKTITALVVDDEGCTRMLHRMLLSRQGIEAVLAENGKEAVDLIRSGQNFDLILMDRDMPVMNGIEVCILACMLIINIHQCQ